VFHYFCKLVGLLILLQPHQIIFEEFSLVFYTLWLLCHLQLLPIFSANFFTRVAQRPCSDFFPFISSISAFTMSCCSSWLGAAHSFLFLRISHWLSMKLMSDLAVICSPLSYFISSSLASLRKLALLATLYAANRCTNRSSVVSPQALSECSCSYTYSLNSLIFPLHICVGWSNLLSLFCVIDVLALLSSELSHIIYSQKQIA
jgi:hypothetical protein